MEMIKCQQHIINITSVLSLINEMNENYVHLIFILLHVLTSLKISNVTSSSQKPRTNLFLFSLAQLSAWM